MTGPELAAHAGLTYRQVDHWTSVGYLRPVEANPGTGNHRHYPPPEVRVAVLMADLVRDGVTPERAARLARRLARNGTARLGGLTLTTRKATA